ncbi:MAG: hypothetical protein ACOH2H_05930 [Cypionkella sp.]
MIGNEVALLAGPAFVLSPRLMTSRGGNIAIFALPPIVIALILAQVLQSFAPRVTLTTALVQTPPSPPQVLSSVWP